MTARRDMPVSKVVSVFPIQPKVGWIGKPVYGFLETRLESCETAVFGLPIHRLLRLFVTGEQAVNFTIDWAPPLWITAQCRLAANQFTDDLDRFSNRDLKTTAQVGDCADYRIASER